MIIRCRLLNLRIKQLINAALQPSVNLKFLITILLIFQWSHQLTIAEDSAVPAVPAFDLNALANIATNLGSNPQVMGLVSTLLNPITAQKSTNSIQTNSNNPVDPVRLDQQDSNFASAEYNSTNVIHSDDASKRRLQNEKQNQPSQGNQPPPPPAPATPTNSLNNLMSLLPSVLPTIEGFLNQNKHLVTTTSSANQAQSAARSNPEVATVATNSQPTPVMTPASSNTNISPAVQALPAASAQQVSSNPAQSVINQILTAYASGQIPNELIQLSLSGRIPQQIIDLALSGQVPPQIIQMVITGQVPMSTINAFLLPLQTNNQPNNQQAPAVSKISTSSGTVTAQAPVTSQGQGISLTSTTKAIFEALLNRSNKQDQTGNSLTSAIKMPTLLGPLPLPNMRKLGKLVGGTISNVASMIPF